MGMQQPQMVQQQPGAPQPGAPQQAIVKQEVGPWQICEDAMGEYYVHLPSGQTFDQPPPELMQFGANWMAGWSVAKKAWCCSNEGKGCPPAAGGALRSRTGLPSHRASLTVAALAFVPSSG